MPQRTVAADRSHTGQGQGHGRGDRPAGASHASRSPVIARNGIAATSHPLATQIAIDILKKGGCAVDAAIAANAALGLMRPNSCGVGGDLFAIVWDPETSKLHGLNGSGRAAQGLSLATLRQKLGNADTMPEKGMYSITVPGAVDGWFSLHEKFGKLPMADLLAPSIAYAREGVPLPQIIAFDWRGAVEAVVRKGGRFGEIENFKALFMPGGSTPVEGQIFRNPDLAGTYERIARNGREGFYGGETAAVIDAYMRRIGGPLRREDLSRHRSEWVEPVSVSYRGYDVFELPPNGQGIAVLQMLNILEGFDLAAMGHNSADYLHVLVEAKKLVFEDRARFYADPAFAGVPLRGLLSKAYAAKRRALIDLHKASADFDPGDPTLENGDTVYLTVADSDGSMVSLIQSNYEGLGSGQVPDGLGFGFQNRGAGFSLQPGHPNQYQPGKRPFHTIIPGFVMKDGAPLLSFGVMGGAMQPQGHVQVLLNMIEFGMDVQAAGDAARYQHMGSSDPNGVKRVDGGSLFVESGVSQDVMENLAKRGHSVAVNKGISYGGYQAIRRDPQTGVYFAASEMRKDGHAAGY